MQINGAIHKIIFVVLIVGNISVNAQHRISYSIADTFSNTLLSYIQARYIGHTTSLSFLYRDFSGSEYLNIQYQAEPYDSYICQYWRRFLINSPQTMAEFLQQIRDSDTPDTLYIIEYAPADLALWKSRDIKPSILFSSFWEDKSFRLIMNNVLAFSGNIPDFRVEGRLNVALYVGKLEGDNVKHSPLCNPNKEYYRNQILRVYDFNLKKPLHICFFGEKNNVDFVVDLRNELQNYDIILSEVDFYDQRTILFSMQKFDVLIATQSNCAMIAAQIGRFEMVLYPIHYQVSNEHCWVDCVEVVSKKSDWFPYALKALYRDYL